MTRLLLTFFALFGLVLTGCATDPDDHRPDPDPDDPVAALGRLELTGIPSTLDPGAAMKINVAAFDVSGESMAAPALTWASSDAAVATVTATGVVTGVASGATDITAKHGGITGTLRVTVREVAATVDHVAIEPGGEIIVTLGDTRQVQAMAYDSQLEALPGRVMTWTSNDDAIVTISQSGEVTAVAAGTATIYVVCEGKTDQATVRVHVPVTRLAFDADRLDLQPGASRQLAVTAYAADDSVLADRAVTWTVADPTIASVNVSGLVTGHADGFTTLTATIEGAEATLPIAVRGVARIVLNFEEATIDLEEQLQLTATLFDATNRPIPGPVTWSSDHPDIVFVTTSGMLQGMAEGGAIITATSGTVTATATIFVATWTERTLTTVNGAAAPTTMFSYPTTIGGVSRQFRVDATDGVLATRMLDGRYELMVFGPAYLDDEHAGEATFTSYGEMAWNAAQQRFVFTPDGFSHGGVFTGRYLSATSLEIVWKPDPAGAAATLVFALN